MLRFRPVTEIVSRRHHENREQRETGSVHAPAARPSDRRQGAARQQHGPAAQLRGPDDATMIEVRSRADKRGRASRTARDRAASSWCRLGGGPFRGRHLSTIAHTVAQVGRTVGDGKRERRLYTLWCAKPARGRRRSA